MRAVHVYTCDLQYKRQQLSILSGDQLTAVRLTLTLLSRAIEFTVNFLRKGDDFTKLTQSGAPIYSTVNPFSSGANLV